MTSTAAALRRIGDVAALTGLTPRAIRYYEQLGLLKPAAHAQGANRRYDADDLERLLLIKRLREVVGLSLADIQTFLDTEDVRRALRAEYQASSDDPAQQLAILDRAEPVLARRIDLLEHKLRSVLGLLEEERARLRRVHALRQSLPAGRPASNGKDVHD